MLLNDFTSVTNNTALHLVESKLGVPDFAKSAKVENLQELSRTSFADTLLKRFPIHTKAAAYHSAVFFLGNHLSDPSVPSHVLDRIKSACELHGISEDFEKIQALFQEQIAQVKSASETTKSYALVIEKEDGVDYYYPINDPLEVEESAQTFAKDAAAGKFPITLAREVAIDIVKAAKQHGTDMRYVPKSVIELGTPRKTDFERAERLTKARCKAAGMSEEAESIYLSIIKEAAEGESDLDDLVKLYYEMDARSGIEKYSAAIPDPFQVFFGGATLEDFEKMANHHVVINELLIPVDVYGRTPDVQFKGNFPAETADRLIALKSASAAEITVGLEKLIKTSDDQKAILRILLETAKS